MTRDKTTAAKADTKRVEWFDPLFASFLRRVSTMFDLHRRCPYKVCRRARACATRHALCYQAMEAEMQPIVQSLVARIWRQSVDDGEERDVAPVRRDGWLRRIAWEEGEIARIRSGACGGDDALSAYQFWLKYWAERIWRPAGKAAPPAPEPYDPDARERDAPWTPPKIVKAGDASPPVAAGEAARNALPPPR